ncbi:MAG TPA: hypothetical protein VFV99_30025, partial [Kofleriaceae bacterium]|nr:hypothetical protein [Kofleriaceae bacterium]
TACVAAMTTSRALGCPRHLQCVVQPDESAPEIARAHKAVAIPDVRSVHVAEDRLTLADAPRKAEPDAMPWIWRVLREQIYTRLPRHDDERFTLVLSPVVVTSPSDTIPGVGIAGNF